MLVPLRDLVMHVEQLAEPLEHQIRERIGAKLAAAADDIERYALAR